MGKRRRVSGWVVAAIAVGIIVVPALFYAPQSPQQPSPVPVTDFPESDPPPVNTRVRTSLAVSRAASVSASTDRKRIRTNLISRILAGEELPKPSPAELQAFVNANNRSPESLLGAFRVTGDRAFLREAMQRWDKDPGVAYCAYYLESSYNNEQAATPQRREWLEKLKEADPGNALPLLLSARDYFKAGETDQALEEVKSAYLKPSLNDYSLRLVQDSEEAYRAAGYSEVEAKAIAACELPLPHLAELKKLQQSLIDQANFFKQAGDPASANAALELASNMTRQMAPGKHPFLISDLVGIAMEKQLLSAMDGTAMYGNSGQSVSDRLAQLQQEREELKVVAKQSEALMMQMTDQDLASYFDRLKLLGEKSALQWGLKKYALQ